MKLRWKLLAAFVLVTIGCVFFVSATIGGAVWYSPDVHTIESKDPNPDPHRQQPHTITVATLNIAHGRNQSAHQLLLSESQLGQNLQKIVDVLDKQNPDVVGLQEIDAPSFWSARQDQAKFLATRFSSLPNYIHGRHVDGFGLHYGTAVLSRLPIASAYSGRFSATPPTFPKGFVIAQIKCPQMPDGVFDFVSVHLDFASSARRSQQADSLIERLAARDSPLIVVGDFNCNWSDSGSVLPKICKELELHTFEATAGKVTFPKTAARLDWILLSKHFKLESFEILPENVSDHLAVVAKLRIR